MEVEKRFKEPLCLIEQGFPWFNSKWRVDIACISCSNSLASFVVQTFHVMLDQFIAVEGSILP